MVPAKPKARGGRSLPRFAQYPYYKQLTWRPASRKGNSPRLVIGHHLAENGQSAGRSDSHSCTNEVGMVLAVVTVACLTNPRVRFGRSPDELNIWAPFRLYS